jgi:hypothetical protein
MDEDRIKDRGIIQIQGYPWIQVFFQCLWFLGI